MTRKLQTVALLVVAGLAASSGPAQTSAPAATAPAVGAAELRILQDLEAAGEKYRTIRADIDYRVDIRTLGDSEERTGWVAYDKGDAKAPTRFRVTFDTLRQGAGKKIASQVDYVFDGEWLHVAKHKIKNLTLYQLAAKGQQIEPLRIGRGPFPLPFGQKADDVVKHFTVATREPLSTDPKDTIYLRLIARPEHARDLPMERIELWIDRATHLPVQIRSREKSKNVTTVVFKDTKTNAAVAADVFDVPRRIGWETVRQPLEPAGKPAP